MLKIVFEIECKSLSAMGNLNEPSDVRSNRIKTIMDNLAALYGLVTSDEAAIYHTPKITTTEE